MKDGFEVQAVIDASGSPFVISEEMARRRMEAAGVTLTATNTIVAELVHDWATKQGGKLVPLLFAVCTDGEGRLIFFNTQTHSTQDLK